jgi:hypothetical protein
MPSEKRCNASLQKNKGRRHCQPPPPPTMPGHCAPPYLFLLYSVVQWWRTTAHFGGFLDALLHPALEVQKAPGHRHHWQGVHCRGVRGGRSGVRPGLCGGELAKKVCQANKYQPGALKTRARTFLIVLRS